METELDKSSIEKLKKKLYAPDLLGSEQDRRPLHANPDIIQSPNPEAWNATPIPEKQSFPEKRTGTRFFKILFLLSLIFCLGAGTLAGVYFVSDKLLISSKNVDITVQSAVSVAGGESLPLTIAFANKNRADLENVVLRIVYPQDSRNPEAPNEEKIREERDLGSVGRDSSEQFTTSIILLGEEGEKKEITVVAEYSTTGSDTRYTKEKIYEVVITQSPLNLVLEYQRDINAGQTIEFDIELSSNAKNELSNILVRAEYPFGFKFKSADPAVTDDQNKNTWLFSRIKPGETQQIRITGVMEGQDNEERIFRFYAGNQSTEDDRKIHTVLATKAGPVNIVRPFLTVQTESLSSRTNGGVALARLGQEISSRINLQNNLDREILDPVVEVRLKGQLYDRSTIRPSNGFYKSVDDVLLWDRATNRDLITIGPGATKNVSFSFRTFTLEQLRQNIRNPEMAFDVLVRGKIVTERGSSENVEIRTEQTIRFTTELIGTAELSHVRGPLPPRAETKTTYAVQWRLQNQSNHISNARVSASLPIYVQYVPIAGASPDISYNELTRTITWEAGEVPAYTGRGGGEKSVSFQIDLLPSTSQVGEVPVLVLEGVVQGVDRFTNIEIDGVLPQITTGVLRNQGVILAP